MAFKLSGGSKGGRFSMITVGIELDNVNHIPLGMNEFRGLGQVKPKKTP